jgi:hypothetical protein
MKYTVISTNSESVIQIIVNGELASNPFDTEDFTTTVIDSEEDNLIEELNAIDETWHERFDLRITPKPRT